MGFKIIVLKFLFFSVVFCDLNTHYTETNSNNEDTLNLLAPIRSHVPLRNDIKSSDVVDANNGNRYLNIAKKLVGIEKIGNDVAESDYLPEEISELEEPKPDKSQKDNLSDFDKSVKETSERLSMIDEAELESDEGEIDEKENFLKSATESFEKTGTLGKLDENIVPGMETELESIASDENLQKVRCIPDYSLLCPNDYVLYGNYCIATKTYNGKCERKIKAMRDENDELKEAWSKECETKWPCMPSKCPRGADYSKRCPSTFIEDGQYCRSNVLGNEVYISFNTVESKKEFETSHQVRWPCKPYNTSDYSKKCPRDFIQLGDECKCIKDESMIECQLFKVTDDVDSKLEIQKKCKIEIW